MLILCSPVKELAPHLRFDTRYFLLPTGIREVKGNIRLCFVSFYFAEDPCFLMDVVEKRACELLVICGPMLSRECFGDFMSRLEGKRFVKYLGNLDVSDVHQLMRGAVCTVNCSLSEGVSNAVMESLALGVPVCARRIPGFDVFFVEILYLKRKLFCHCGRCKRVSVCICG